jgi:hypothetical protein
MCPTHLILLDFITRKIIGEKYRLSSSLSSFLHYPVISPLVGPNIPLNPYSQTPSAYIPPSYMSATPTYFMACTGKTLSKYAYMA